MAIVVEAGSEEIPKESVPRPAPRGRAPALCHDMHITICKMSGDMKVCRANEFCDFGAPRNSPLASFEGL